MRKMKQMKFALSLILFLTNSAALTVKAQNESASLNLDGSQWQARIAWKNTETLSTKDFASYDFGMGRKVKYFLASSVEKSVISVVPKRDEYGDILGSETERRSTTDVRTTGGEGTYALKGLMIQIDFSDHTIDAKINGNKMEGIITIKKTGERGLWDAERVSKITVTQSESKIDKEQKFKEFFEEAQKLQKQERYREAIEAYTLAINLNPNDYRIMEAFYQRASSKFELQNYRGAIADYDQFFTLYQKEEASISNGKGLTDSILFGLRNSSNAYYYRGMAKEKLGDKIGSCEDFREACKLVNNMACDKVKKVCSQK